MRIGAFNCDGKALCILLAQIAVIIMRKAHEAVATWMTDLLEHGIDRSEAKRVGNLYYM